MRRARALRGAATALLLAVLVGCDRTAPPPPPTPRVIVLGIDGFSPNVLIGMLGRNLLPNFNRFAREGCTSRLSTKDAGLPPFSPRIWASFATGVLPAEHGIVGFVKGKGADAGLYSSLDRRVPAVWEIASGLGKRVGVVNWLTTYPADPVNGFMISERWLASTAAKPDPRLGAITPEGLVHPPELLASLATLGIQQAGHPPREPAEAEAEDRNVLRMTWAAVAQHPVDLLMIYTNGVDALQHLRWNTHELLPGEPKPPEDKVEALAMRWDVMLGEVMAHLTPVDHLIVLSDHGAERNKGPGLPGTHESAAAAVGILLVLGPGVATVPVSATTLDVAPTILELLGIPPSKSMPGRVLPCVIPQGTQPLPRREQPYERPKHADAAPKPLGGVDDAIRQRLKDLGYLDE